MHMVSKSFPLREMYQKNDQLIIAEWQRGVVWDLRRKQKLMDSILRGWSLPKFYFAHSGRGDGKLYVVDGQQRLSTTSSFLENHFKLSSATQAGFNLTEGSYSALPSHLSHSLDVFSVQYDEISNATAGDLKTFFYRLQQGMALTGQERLNAVAGELSGFCRDLTQHEFLQTRIAFGNTRYKFLDLTTKVTATVLSGLGADFSFEGIKKLFEAHAKFSQGSPAAQHVKATFDFMAEAFASKTSIFKKLPIVLSYVTLASHLVASGESTGRASAFGSFIEKFHSELQEAIASGVTVGDPEYINFYKATRLRQPTGSVMRHEILLRKLQVIDAQLGELVTLNEDVPSWLASLPQEERVDDYQARHRSFRTIGKKTARIIQFPHATPAGGESSSLVIMHKSEAIGSIYKKADHFLIPEWQRSEVWDRARKQALIDSVLRQWKLPKLYVAQIEDQAGYVEVVDGQQRLSTILAFMNDEFPLSALSAKDLGLKATYFSQLPAAVAAKFQSFKIEYDEITGASQQELTEIYQRLQEGVRLSSSEKLNATQSGMRDFCVELVDHPFFQSRVSFTNKRHMLFDLASKIVAIEANGLFAHLDLAGLQRVFQDNANFLPSNPIAQRVDATLSFLVKAFPSRTTALESRTVTQSVFTLASQLVKSGKGEGQEAAFGKFIKEFYAGYVHERGLKGYATDKDYVTFGHSIGTHKYDGAQVRHLALIVKMKELAPRLHEAFIQDQSASRRTLINAASPAAPSAPGLLFLKQGDRTARAPS